MDRKISNKKYYESNKDKILKQNKKWAENNKDKMQAYSRKSYAKNKKKREEYRNNNKEKLRINNKIWRDANKEKIKTDGKIYREKNKEKISIKKKLYQEKNKENIKKKKIEYYNKKKKERIEKYGKKTRKPFTEEHKRKIGEANQGNKRSKELCKKHSEWMKGRTGELSANWQGGLSFFPYPINFNTKFKEKIRLRDNYICLKCGTTEEQLETKLCIHHIDYIKQNTYPKNCCSLCRKCNSQVNKDRNFWTKFFKRLLFTMYGYEYNKGDLI